jgi:hypothetical protein
MIGKAGPADWRAIARVSPSQALAWLEAVIRAKDWRAIEDELRAEATPDRSGEPPVEISAPALRRELNASGLAKFDEKWTTRRVIISDFQIVQIKNRSVQIVVDLPESDYRWQVKCYFTEDNPTPKARIEGTMQTNFCELFKCRFVP